MANNYTSFSCFLPLTPEQTAYATELLLQMEDYNSDDPEPSIRDLMTDTECVEFAHKPQKDGYWFYTEGSGNPEQLALFIQHLIEYFNLPPFGFDWSYSCSKPRIDEFGGGAIWIAREGFEWLSTDSWLYEKLHSRETR